MIYYIALALLVILAYICWDQNYNDRKTIEFLKRNNVMTKPSEKPTFSFNDGDTGLYDQMSPPLIGWVGDPDVGMGSPSADRLSIIAGGVEMERTHE